ncbi:hypothetical protein F4692_001469 [Nocardioides cavernae]|uniref:WD40 repeat domain-containing protein n=1 Tax=Nocardioides cavernae TaxID=1921566 RepID=A0A7Y9H1R3_9ACTN|nr:hypothetical protein [Nocardioides cavernae]NYE36365.1 hypothetical protein [Nocardioides cavernae]
MTLLRRSSMAVVGLACAVVVTGCSDAGSTTSGDASWPSTGSPVDADGLVWASGGEVHLPDGSTIDTGDLTGSYVVAGPGVWFAAAEPGELEQNRLPELRLATPDGIEDTGAHPGIGSLTATTDGRWLAFIDRLDEGAGSAEAVVVDLTTGEEVVRSDEGLVPDDSPGDEDWTDLYEDAPVSVFGVVDGTAYVGGLGDVIAHDLSSGEVETLDLSGTDLVEQDWYRALNPEPPLWNADRSWSILEQPFSAPVSRLRPADGAAVTTTVPGGTAREWLVGGWLDDDTAVALTPTPDGADVSWTMPALLTCEVPSGECTTVEGTEGGVNLPADRPFGVPREDSIRPG